MNFDDSLFNNELVRNAIKNLTPEQLQMYKNIGKEMYENLDSYTSKDVNFQDIDSIMSDAVKYIEEGLKSGLHPSLLEDNEKIIMQSTYGEKWYEKYGYSTDYENT